MTTFNYTAWETEDDGTNYFHSLTQKLPESFDQVQEYLPETGPDQDFEVSSEYIPSEKGIKITLDGFDTNIRNLAGRMIFKGAENADDFLVAVPASTATNPYDIDGAYKLVSWVLTKGETITQENSGEEIVLGVTTMLVMRNADGEIGVLQWKWQGYDN